MHMHMHMMMHMQVEAKLMHMGQKSKRITDEEMGKRQPYGFGLGRYKYKYKNTQINFCDSPKYSLQPIVCTPGANQDNIFQVNDQLPAMTLDLASGIWTTTTRNQRRWKDKAGCGRDFLLGSENEPRMALDLGSKVTQRLEAANSASLDLSIS